MSKEKNNITTKIFALLIAIVLWSYVMGTNDPERDADYKNITVNLNNISALERQNLVIMDPQEATINVRVVGRKSELDKKERFSAENIIAQADLSGYSEGQFKVPVTVSLQNQGTSVRIKSWEPREILFTFDKLVTKDMPVSIETTGDLPVDYMLGNIIIKPQNVLIKGPRTWVNNVYGVKAIIDLNNRTNTETNSYPIKIVDGNGNDIRGVEKEPNLVEIQVPVFRKATLPIELKTINELPDNYAITNINISPSRVEVKGNNDIVNLINISTKEIDINILLDKVALDVELDLPEGVELVNPDEKITIFYNIEEVITKEIIYRLREINVINLDKDLMIDNLDENIEVITTIKGIKSVMDNTNKNDLDLYMDFMGLAEGRHTLDINMRNIPGVNLIELIPKQINIDLKRR